MSINNLPQLAPGELEPAVDLVTVYHKKTGEEMKLQLSAIAASPSGVSGAIQFSNGSAFASDASNLFWDDANNRLGVGTTTPTTNLTIYGGSDTLGITGPVNQAKSIQIARYNSSDPLNHYIGDDGGAFFGSGLTISASGTNSQLYLQVASSGRNVNIGTAGQTLLSKDMDARLGVRGSGQTAATTSLLVQNSIGTNTLRVYDDRVVEVPYRIHTPFIRNENANLVLYSGSYEIEIQSSNPTNASGSLRTTGDITTTDNQTKNVINVNNLVSSTSASFNTLNGFAFTSTITQTTGTIRGLFINPTLNASTDFKAIQSTSGGAYINTSTPNASAILQADSTTKGFLPPRMTTTQRDLISSVATGLVLYNTTTNKLQCYNGSTWNDLF